MKGNAPAKSLKLALYGLDDRAYKTMSLFLEGPCKSIAVVVDEADAEIDLIDADHIKARELLDDRQANGQGRPLILLSLEELAIAGTIFVKKPVKTSELVAALKQAKTELEAKQPKKIEALPERIAKPKVTTKAEKDAEIEIAVAEKSQESADSNANEEAAKISKHRTAKDLTEASFSAYVGQQVEDVDFSNVEQAFKASFNPKAYFLGCVQVALRTCKEKSRNLQLNTGWKPVLFFSDRQEVWLDSDDKQLRAYAKLATKNNPSQKMTLSSIDKGAVDFNKKIEAFYDVDYFLWKLAIWTSKGRYPETIDINRPVYLIQWPNFTRLVVTPHAMRIAALLVREPRTAMSIASALKINLQYVFVFISAANAVGLVGQARRQVDQLIAPPEVKASKSKGLLSRILGRLRDSKRN